MKTVFILGAGASRGAGAPLMDDFLDRAADLHRLGVEGVRDAKEDFDRVLELLTDLQAIHAKSYLDLDNVETLFGAVEMGRLLGRLRGREPAEIELLRSSLIRLIVKTLEYSTKYPVISRSIRPPPPYDDFASMLIQLKEKRGSRALVYMSFLTFNYDLCLDCALYANRLSYSYMLSQEPPSGSLPLLKLHGSINWGLCSECGEIVPYDLGAANFNLWKHTEHVFFNLGSSLSRISHCDEPLPDTPVLVPPTWDKGNHHAQVGSVWQQAARELGEAENIFVIGYSLPESDLFFRYLFALGTEGPSRLRRLWVFNPDEDGSVRRRFQALVGRGVERRFEFFDGESGLFKNAIGRMETALSEDMGIA